jgi:hypothetical protein
MGLEAGGFSTTSLVGTDRNNLSWQVNHAAGRAHHITHAYYILQSTLTGTQLLLSMADANGNPGEMATALYTVTREFVLSHTLYSNSALKH